MLLVTVKELWMQIEIRDEKSEIRVRNTVKYLTFTYVRKPERKV